MIISYTHNFIFLHCRKTAGSSVSLALLPFLEEPDIFYDNIDMANPLPRGYRDVHPFVNLPYAENTKQRLRLIYAGSKYASGLPTKGNHALYRAMHNRYAERIGIKGNGGVHATAEEIKNAIGEKDWNRMYKFCFVRNPWDFLPSFYFWRSRRMKQIRPSFREFVSILYEGQERHLPFNASGWRNWRLYTIDDQIAVDYVASYHNLAGELEGVAQKLGLSGELSIPRANASSRPEGADVASMYDAESIRKVGEMFDKEIEHFGWEPPKAA